MHNMWLPISVNAAAADLMRQHGLTHAELSAIDGESEAGLYWGICRVNFDKNEGNSKAEIGIA